MQKFLKPLMLWDQVPCQRQLLSQPSVVFKQLLAPERRQRKENEKRDREVKCKTWPIIQLSRTTPALTSWHLTRTAACWGRRRRDTRWRPCTAPVSSLSACWSVDSDTAPDSPHTSSAAWHVPTAATILSLFLQWQQCLCRQQELVSHSLGLWFPRWTAASGCGSAFLPFWALGG